MIADNFLITWGSWKYSSLETTGARNLKYPNNLSDQLLIFSSFFAEILFPYLLYVLFGFSDMSWQFEQWEKEKENYKVTTYLVLSIVIFLFTSYPSSSF